MNSKHFFLDGYNINSELLSNVERMHIFIDNINKIIFNNKGKVVIIPYFKGKIKEDGGVSGIILGDNSHFTCHTFCYKNTYFLDYFGAEKNHNNIKNMALDIYPTKDYDLCQKNDIEGKFGKHIIIRDANTLTFNESKKLIDNILTEIEMTPIREVIENKKNEYEYDLLQPIAESHISIHREKEKTTIDTFSCKWFDEEKLLNITKSKKYIKVNRGIKYK